MEIVSRIDKIADYGTRYEQAIEDKRNEEKRKKESILKDIENRKDRINNLILTAQACQENYISIVSFLADGFHHNLGFTDEHCGIHSKMSHLSYIGGGACGATSSHVDIDGNLFFAHERKGFQTADETPYTDWFKMSKFGTDFDAFEMHFYDYVDKKVNEKIKV